MPFSGPTTTIFAAARVSALAVSVGATQITFPASTVNATACPVRCTTGRCARGTVSACAASASVRKTTVGSTAHVRRTALHVWMEERSAMIRAPASAASACATADSADRLAAQLRTPPTTTKHATLTPNPLLKEKKTKMIIKPRATNTSTQEAKTGVIRLVSRAQSPTGSRCQRAIAVECGRLRFFPRYSSPWRDEYCASPALIQARTARRIGWRLSVVSFWNESVPSTLNLSLSTKTTAVFAVFVRLLIFLAAVHRPSV